MQKCGLLAPRSWFSTWRTMEQLLAYAKNGEAEHLPAWRAFNKAIGIDGSVGIWHETYAVSPGTYENIYVNMPPFGLGKAGSAYAATGGKELAAGRMRVHENAP